VANWRRAWRLSPAERWLLAQALALLPLTALALWAVGFRRGLVRARDHPPGSLP
jgi:hypothetical protein